MSMSPEYIQPDPLESGYEPDYNRPGMGRMKVVAKYPLDPFDRWGRRYGDWVAPDFDAFEEKARRAPLNYFENMSHSRRARRAYLKTTSELVRPPIHPMGPYKVDGVDLNEEQGLPELAKRKSPSAREYIQKKYDKAAEGNAGGWSPRIFTPTFTGGDAVFQAHEGVEKRRLTKLGNKRHIMDFFVKNNPEKFKQYLIENEGNYSQAVRDYIARHRGA